MSRIEETHDKPLGVVFGLSGETLRKEEKSFFREANPLGFILFARNCAEPGQLQKLIRDLRDCVSRDVPILIDQEGGRVQRLKPPHWKAYPAARMFGEAFLRNFSEGRRMMQESFFQMASEARAAGFNVDCAPVMDVFYPQTHEVIGDRAFSADPEMVAVLGALACEQFLKAGIIPVIKHMPGHGRAEQDSHAVLPVVSALYRDMKKTDLIPFRELMGRAISEAVWGMVAHVVYMDIDERAPASCSRKVIWDVIRRDIGFSGLLLSDDICMGALEGMGDAGARAEKAQRAGCDVVLHCNGEIKDMEIVAGRAQKMTGDAVMRYNRSVSWVKRNFKDA